MNFDPELMQDFLTESGELLDQLDTDLVTLESSPTDPDLLNRIFRALHTIKGSASFLTLTNLVELAHATETYLNAARNKQLVVDRPAMDMLLASVDTIKRQFDNIRNGQDLVKGDAKLIATLTALGEGKPVPTTVAATAPKAVATAAASVQAPVAANSKPASGSADPFASAPTEKPLTLPASKADLLDYLVADVEQSLDQIQANVSKLTSEFDRPGAAAALGELTDALKRSVDFFDFAPMMRMVKLLGELADHASDLGPVQAPAVIAPATQAVALIREQCKGLSAGKLITRDVERFAQSFHDLIASASALSATVTPAPIAAPAPAAPEPVSSAPQAPVTAPEPTPNAVASAPESPKADHADAGKPTAGEQTIRVEVGRLETLLNLVGELVLQKNRIGALGRQLNAQGLGTQEFREALTASNSALDRVTSDLQLAVMKTRMQPLDKLFGKYPRLIRDLARKLNKNIELVIEGGATEVDKSVIEELGDPLIHLMRNSADHGIEMPDKRKAAGKSETGTIKITAANVGGHVEICIIDDGKGLHRDFLAKKALEKGLYTQAQLDAMTDREVYNIIFAAGFSTAEKLSDVSGRGVGMDVVRTNIEKLKGTIALESTPGHGCTVRIQIPLTVAIMSAMMVGAGKEIYAVPLSAIVEIVKPEGEQLTTIRGSSVMRLRDSVLPLVDAARVFNQPEHLREQSPFAVVLQVSDKRFGLLVSRLIGQQEVVIKPLDETSGSKGPVSGATVRDDGGVSLIVDVNRLMHLAEARK